MHAVTVISTRRSSEFNVISVVIRAGFRNSKLSSGPPSLQVRGTRVLPPLLDSGAGCKEGPCTSRPRPCPRPPTRPFPVVRDRADHANEGGDNATDRSRHLLRTTQPRVDHHRPDRNGTAPSRRGKRTRLGGKAGPRVLRTRLPRGTY